MTAQTSLSRFADDGLSPPQFYAGSVDADILFFRQKDRDLQAQVVVGVVLALGHCPSGSKMVRRRHTVLGI
jgi:hypothetical protein